MGFPLFARRLQHLRNRCGYMREELSIAIDVDAPMIEAFEAGSILPSSRNLDRLACMLGVTPMRLIHATEAEASYVTARLTRLVEPIDDEDRYELRTLLHALMHMQSALLRLYRAVWRQKAYHPDPLCEAIRAELTPRCESLRDLLEKIAYPDIGECVQFPDRILERPREAHRAGRKAGELANTCWQPMLYRAQQWIVRELAAIGGQLLPCEIEQDDIMRSLHGELDTLLIAIARIDCTNFHTSVLFLFGEDAYRYIDLLNSTSLS